MIARVIGALVVLVLVASTAFAFGRLSVEHPPNCPTEDSCIADYHDDTWHIQPVVP